MTAKERLIFARKRWEIARSTINRVTGKRQWERRDGSYICDAGDEIAGMKMPTEPSSAALSDD